MKMGLLKFFKPSNVLPTAKDTHSFNRTLYLLTVCPILLSQPYVQIFKVQDKY